MLFTVDALLTLTTGKTRGTSLYNRKNKAEDGEEAKYYLIHPKQLTQATEEPLEPAHLNTSNARTSRAVQATCIGQHSGIRK
jgi:hypothetical protein